MWMKKGECRDASRRDKRPPKVEVKKLVKPASADGMVPGVQGQNRRKIHGLYDTMVSIFPHYIGFILCRYNPSVDPLPFHHLPATDEI
jgi:hypothetical protein